MKMTAKKITIDELRNSDSRGYNPSEWDRQIDRMLKYDEVEFYHVGKGSGYDYERHFVEYTLPEGLRLFASFSYGGSITNGGFYRLDKTAITDDGRTYANLVELVEQQKLDEAKKLGTQLANANLFEISYGTFTDADGNQCLYNTSKEARKKMSELSRKHYITFTKG